MPEQVSPNRSWLAIASFIISILALCSLPIPLIPSSLLGGIGSIMGGLALWRIRKTNGTNRDRFFAVGGIFIGILPIISFCVTAAFLAREIPKLATLLSNLFR